MGHKEKTLKTPDRLKKQVHGDLTDLIKLSPALKTVLEFIKRTTSQTQNFLKTNNFHFAKTRNMIFIEQESQMHMWHASAFKRYDESLHIYLKYHWQNFLWKYKTCVIEDAHLTYTWRDALYFLFSSFLRVINTCVHLKVKKFTLNVITLSFWMQCKVYRDEVSYHGIH